MEVAFSQGSGKAFLFLINKEVTANTVPFLLAHLPILNEDEIHQPV
jgi:hypothetical protein